MFFSRITKLLDHLIFLLVLSTRAVQALLADHEILLELAMHLHEVLQRVPLGPPRLQQLSPSPQERGAREAAQGVLALVLALLCDGSARGVQGLLEPVHRAPLSPCILQQAKHPCDSNLIGELCLQVLHGRV